MADQPQTFREDRENHGQEEQHEEGYVRNVRRRRRRLRGGKYCSGAGQERVRRGQERPWCGEKECGSRSGQDTRGQTRRQLSCPRHGL